MREALIISGGSIDIEFGSRYMREHLNALKVAVDSGMEFYYKQKILPDIIVGDFDSVSGQVINYFRQQKGISWIELVPEKDDTDTEAAVRRVIAEGCDTIHLLGATGSRLDHMLGNIQLLGIALTEGAEMFMVDANNRLRMIKQGITVRKSEQYGKYISLLPFTPNVMDVTLKGMKYPLLNFKLECYSSIGISNEIIEDEGVISFTDGVLLVIESRDESME